VGRAGSDDSVEQERVEDRRLEVSSDADAEAVVDKLAGLVLREAVPFAERRRPRCSGRSRRNRARARPPASLERELAARGLSESPLWYEHTLDHLHDTPVERAQQLARGVTAAAGLPRGVTAAAGLGVREVRALGAHRPPPDLSPPAWLGPPDRAAYGVPKSPCLYEILTVASDFLSSP
jgi:hypothetical protein